MKFLKQYHTLTNKKMSNSITSCIVGMFLEDKFPVTINQVGFNLISIQSFDFEKEKVEL